MPSSSAIPALRATLLAQLAVLATVAILVAIGAVTLLRGVAAPEQRALYVAFALVTDVTVFVAITAYIVQRLVVLPLRVAVSAAEAVASGDLQRRVPAGSSRELHDLATSVNRMTDRLLEEQAQLVRAEKLASVGRLAAGVAHEIGNPLGAIGGYLYLLRGRLGDVAKSADVRETFASLEREIDRMGRIVRGLLDYSRSRPQAPTPIDVNDVVRAVAELLTTQGVLTGIEVTLDLPPEALYVHGDRHDLEQLIVNLLLNAADAMERSGKLAIRVERTARIALRQPAVRRVVPTAGGAIEHAPSTRAQLWLAGHDAAEIAKIVVADSGPGVAPELADRIFDPFFTTKEAGKGTGLGLAIVARIVDNLHGTIWVTSAREGGAAFHVLFPIAPTTAGSRRFTPPISRARALTR